MDKMDLMKLVDEITASNREHTRNINEKLCTIRGEINRLREVLEKEAADEAYNRGLNDAWELARKICNSTQHGGLSCDELELILGRRYVDDIFFELTYEEANKRVAKYIKKKEEETQSFKRGDVVECKDLISNSWIKAIYIGGNGLCHVVLEKIGNEDLCLDKTRWTLTKTGEHIDFGEF